MKPALIIVAIAFAGCSAVLPPLPSESVAPAALGHWNLTPEPTEVRLDIRHHGMVLWELERDACFGPRVYAWAVTEDDEPRPEPLPPGTKASMSIGNRLIGIDSTWYEAEIRRELSHPGHRLALCLRSRYAWLNNVDGGWGN